MSNSTKSMAEASSDRSNPEAEGIVFTCRFCQQPLEAYADMVSGYIDCPKCGKRVQIPLHVLSLNPFNRPLRQLLANMTNIQWRPPYFPQVIEAAALGFVIVIMVILYLTIGIASQILSIFQGLMLDASREIKTGSLVEKSAYAIATGIYLILWVPFWLVLLPFAALGWTWKHLRYFGLVLVAIVVITCIVLVRSPDTCSYIANFFSRQWHKTFDGTTSQFTKAQR